MNTTAKILRLALLSLVLTLVASGSAHADFEFDQVACR